MSVTITGFDQLQKVLQDFPANIQKDIHQEIIASALTIVRNAQSNAPNETGTLARRISWYESGPLEVTVASPTIYSAYQEFGTGDLVSVPLGFEELAEKARGRGVRHQNLPPHAFLIPSYEAEIPQLLTRINAILNAALNG